MAHHKRKRARKQTVGCPCCHIPKDNSKERTKPKDLEVRGERIPVNYDPIARRQNIVFFNG